MKRLLFLLQFSWALPSVLSAQNDLDVLRYSQTTIGGDARFLGMGGSMGALGANLSCINFNPAGIAMFRKGEMAFSGGLRFANAEATHYGTTTRDFRANVNLGLIGFASSWEEESPYKDERSKKRFKDWSRRHTIGFTYNKIANFNTNVSIQGITHGSTIIDDFLGSAQGYQAGDLNQFYEGMAFNTYLIDTFPGTLTQYGTYFNTDKSFRQSKTINTTGGINEYSFAYGYAMDNKTYFGVSMGIPSGKWNYTSEYVEEDYGDSTEYFKSLDYTETVQTRAIGVNLKLGVITRVSEGLRVGAYFHTPTVYSLTDTYLNTLSARYDSLFGYTDLSLSDSSGTGRFKYNIRTPMRAGVNLGYVYNKILAFNIDAEYMSYNQGNIRSKTYVFQDVNNAIRKKYASTFNFRAGIEFNTSPVVFRAGFASYGSPFGPVLSGKNVRNTITGGIGFRENEKHYFDIAVVYDMYGEDYYIYNPEYVNATSIKHKTTGIVLTYGIKF
jgi:hypothetical protein